MERVSVKDKNGTALMPTKASRARRWVDSGKASEGWSDLGVYYVQLIGEPSGYETQSIVVGIDPGKLYSGIAVQSAKFTLFLGHLILPFARVRARMDQRKLLRRGRRGRRIDRSKPFALRNHRQKRFDNRRGNKLAPSIRANRQLELRVVKELFKLYPITQIGYELIKADVDLTSGRKKARSGKGFSPVMVGQKWMVEQLKQLGDVFTVYGWQKDGNGTSQVRKYLGLAKTKDKKSRNPDSHAVDGLSIASSRFISYRKVGGDSMRWVGSIKLTKAPFKVVTRFGAVKRGKEYGFFRRQLQFEKPDKSGNRKVKGIHGTVHGFRAGDFVKATKGKATVFGYIGGYCKPNNVFAIYDWQWKRIGQFSASKTRLIRRSNGLAVA